MKRERNIFKTIVVACAITATMVCSAQTLSDFREKLSLFERSDKGEFMQYANVVVREDSSAMEAFEALHAQNTEYDNKGVEIKNIPSVDGYRIGVFFSNNASARARALKVVERCDSLFSEIPVTMSYDNPYFKVSAGYCTTQQEAVMLLHRIQRYFPNAYLMRDVITVDNIVDSRNREIRIQEEARRVADSLAMADSLSMIQ